MEQSKPNYRVPFILVTCLFFLWGFLNNLNGVLIPHLRKALQLTNMESTLVDTAVYLAYFLAAIPAGMLLSRVGYKYGIIVGLGLFCVGTALFIPAANSREYMVFLTGLFVIGAGLTILETSANLYVTKLGDEATATVRLNLAQSFNGLAAFLAPMVGTAFILSGKEYSPSALSNMTDVARMEYLNGEAASVKGPYMALSGVLLALIVVFYFAYFPELKDENVEEKASGFKVWDSLKNGTLRLAVTAQFFAVGAQVCVTSFFVRMGMRGGGLDEKTAGYYLGIYGLLFMIGRFVGTILLQRIAAGRLLSIYAGACILLTLVAIFGAGEYVVVALGGLGFFMSIMFPTIFSLGVSGFSGDKKSASSLIVMSIIGGAIFPVIMGKIIDLNHENIQVGYVVPLVCYFVVLWFGLGFKNSRI